MRAFETMQAAMREAESINRQADNVANQMARMLRGRLRLVSETHLRALKRELTQFDANRRIWKENK